MSITPLMPVYPRCGVRPVRGEGAYLIGERGERYLDFASGIAVNLLGHGHPHLTQAIQQQAATLMHTSNLYGSPQGEAFAQRLVDTTNPNYPVFAVRSGASVTDPAASGGARKSPGRWRPTRLSCCSTSRSPVWIPCRFWISSASSNICASAGSGC